MRNCHHPDLSLFASVLWFKTSPLGFFLFLSQETLLLLCVQFACAFASLLVLLCDSPATESNPPLLGENPKSFILKVNPGIILLEWAAPREMCMSSKKSQECSHAPFPEHPQLISIQRYILPRNTHRDKELPENYG